MCSGGGSVRGVSHVPLAGPIPEETSSFLQDRQTEEDSKHGRFSGVKEQSKDSLHDGD